MTDQVPVTHHRATVNGVTLHYVAAGDEAAPLAVLLHGFPEFWYSWRHQIPALVAAGYRVLAPDMRGYNTSDKPKGVGAYHIKHLTADVMGFIQHAGAEAATLVAHDWGGVVGWYMPMLYPQAVEKLVVMNAPHPVRYQQIARTWKQLRKSWYAYAFQLPWLPEWGFRRNDFAVLDTVLRKGSVSRDAFSVEDVERYKEAMRHPGAPTAMINYYRALVRGFLRRTLPRPRRIECPTLLIWGEQDVALDIANSAGLEADVAALRVERIPEASHWVQCDAPERVNGLLLDFLGEG